MTVELLTYVAIGFVAELIDGAIGMAYGVISTTALLSAGLSPLAVTANIHFAELITGSINGGFHLRRGHISWPLVRRLALTGSLGGFVGAALLITLTPRSMEAVRRGIAVYLLLLGLWLCWKGLGRRTLRERRVNHAGILGLVGGACDAAGGGWGPIVTSNLMVSGVAPRVAIGSSIVAECIVTAVHAVTFAGLGGLRPDISMAGLLIGGVLAAPLAPRLTARLSVPVIITTVGIAVVVASTLLIFR